MTADTNPADDQPTWTVDEERRPQWRDFTGRDDWVLEADDLTYQLWTGCTTTEAAHAALVRAVEQARLLPEVEAERDHWKANHDEQVRRKRHLHEMYEGLLRGRQAQTVEGDPPGSAEGEAGGVATGRAGETEASRPRPVTPAYARLLPAALDVIRLWQGGWRPRFDLWVNGWDPNQTRPITDDHRAVLDLLGGRT